ncbi:MAG: helix-turn-helix domain-containing protein [Desulfurellales bacterium]|nr:MAG: helix-turn-helix domain-containing protein [Desulfurellales bacterium]
MSGVDRTPPQEDRAASVPPDSDEIVIPNEFANGPFRPPGMQKHYRPLKAPPQGYISLADTCRALSMHQDWVVALVKRGRLRCLRRGRRRFFRRADVEAELRLRRLRDRYQPVVRSAEFHQMLTLRVSNLMIHALTRCASNQDIARSEAIRDAVHDYLMKHDAEYPFEVAAARANEDRPA